MGRIAGLFGCIADQANVLALRRLCQCEVEGGKGCGGALGQLEIRGVVAKTALLESLRFADRRNSLSEHRLRANPAVQSRTRQWPLATFRRKNNISNPLI